MSYYILVVSGGTEICKDGPYPTFEERDAAARSMWNNVADQDTENLFWLDVGEDAEVKVGAFIGGDLDE